MKSKKGLTYTLIVGGVLAGVISYFLTLVSNYYWVQLLPLWVFPLCIFLFLSDPLRALYSLSKGTALIMFSQLSTFFVLFLLLRLAPSKASKTMDIPADILIIFASAGIGILITFLLRILIYYEK